MAEKPVLVINPGSTSTRIAIFRGEKRVSDQHLPCPAEALKSCARSIDQVPLRSQQVAEFLSSSNTAVTDLAAIAARGGPLKPIPGGVYRINQAMLDDAMGPGFVEHVSRIACLIASELARDAAIPAFVVDPVSTDEYEPIARLSGLRELPRQSLIHALNLRAVARLHASAVGRPYEDMNLITAQLGGGCSIAVHCRGRMIDSVDANGEGPFSPERSGGLRVDSLARFALESGKDFAAIRRMLTREAGLMSHLGTSDAKEAEDRAASGDAQAALVMDAMAYSIAKHICALAAAVNGKVDAVILTGGQAKSEAFTQKIRERVGFLAPVLAVPGEHEMDALASGARRALSGKERVRVYPTGEYET